MRAPAGEHRADRQRELHQPRRDGGAGLGADQQIRRGLSRRSAGTAAARTWTWSSNWPSTAPRQLFGAEHANVQPHSGSGANMAVYFAFLKPGDKMLTMDLSHGGHLTHGNKANFSGKFFEIVHYGVRKEDERIDYDQLAQMARGAPAEDDHRRRQRLSAHHRFRAHGARLRGRWARTCWRTSRTSPAWWRRGLHPSPVPHADFVTTTTHKTLRGPRGGLILCTEKYAKEIDSQVFPGIQGGPLMHVIAAKAVCFQEALQPAVQGLPAADRQERRGPGRRHEAQRLPAGQRRHRQPPDAGGRGRAGRDRQGLPDRARRGRHHRQQEHHPLRDPLAVPGQRHPPGHARRSPPAA